MNIRKKCQLLTMIFLNNSRLLEASSQDLYASEDLNSSFFFKEIL